MRAWHLVEWLHILRMFVVVCRNTMTQVWWVDCYKGVFCLYVWVGYVFFKRNQRIRVIEQVFVFFSLHNHGLRVSVVYNLYVYTTHATKRSL